MKTIKNNKRTLAGTIITGALILFAAPGFANAISAPGLQDSGKIRPFHINVPEAALTDLRQRVLATRWPDKETVTDQTQGVKLEQIQNLVKYWGTDYDWRKAEAKLNALPQFVTNIDGLDIQFVHVRSKNPNALPLIITHG
ncbi:MAG: alpha/beta fold hydrolase, partial [Mucilaginibacter sp.]|nr:alpha/beta fold hydrolase [Mucilaginibacter sp.]